jgi:hypothetical protein
MRAGVAWWMLAALPACTIFNPLDPRELERDAGCAGCVENDLTRCTNGQDDDLDGLADCADPACAHLLACFPQLSFTRAPRCPPTRPAFLLRDDFADFDADTWSSFGAPVVAARGLDVGLNGGIATQAKFGTGSEQLFDAMIVLINDGACENSEPDQRCTFAIDLHTRDDWTSGALGGESIFGVSISAMKDPGRFELRCTYHERALGPSGSQPARTDLSNRLLFDIEATLSGRIELRHDGQVLCTTPIIQPLEPPARLVLRRRCASRFARSTSPQSARAARLGGR